MSQFILLCLLLMVLVASMPEELQYCAIRYRRLCLGKGRHIACQFPDSGAGPSCERYTQIKFTNDLRHFVTHYLNRRRQRIAAGNERVRGGVHLPKPQIMMFVEWDRELAFLAQRLADQCNFVHDDCRATVKFPYAGQTVGEVRWRRFSDSDELSAQRAIRRVLDAWWGERRRVQPKQIIAPFRLAAKGTIWGHFSQLAVWNLQAVGCGAVRHGARHPHLLLVCDFSHTNMLGQRTIVPGPPSPCPIHTARRLRSPYPALCTPVRHDAPDELEEEIKEYENEEEFEETSDVEDMSTPSVWIKRRKQDEKPDPTENSQITNTIPVTPSEFAEEVTRKLEIDQFRLKKPQFALTMTPILPIKELIREDLDRVRERTTEEEARKKALFKKNKLFNPAVQSNWSPKKTIKRPLKQWDQSEAFSIPEREHKQVIPSSASQPPRRLPLKTPESVMVELYRPTISEDTTNKESPFRQRWKQTRVRPSRPGANAFLVTTTEYQPKKSIVASINLDNEDIEQLFLDTGFKLT